MCQLFDIICVRIDVIKRVLEKTHSDCENSSEESELQTFSHILSGIRSQV